MQTLQGSSSGAGQCSSAGIRSTLAHEPPAKASSKFQYPYWKEQWDAELWIPAVNWHFIPWLKRSFDFAPKVLKQQMGHGIKMYTHKYSVKNPSCRKRQVQPPRKTRYVWFQQVPIQWAGYYRVPRSPLCHAALPCHSDEGFLSWFRVLMMVKAYPCFCAPPLLIAHWFGEVILFPCPHHPTWGIPIPHPAVLGGSDHKLPLFS